MLLYELERRAPGIVIGYIHEETYKSENYYEYCSSFAYSQFLSFLEI